MSAMEVVVPGEWLGADCRTERHVFDGRLVAGRFPWVGCRFCNARLVRDGHAYTLYVNAPKWHRMVHIKAVVG